MTARLGFGALLTWFVFRRTDWSQVMVAIGALHVLPLTLAVLSVLSALFVRAQRGVYVVRAGAPSTAYGAILGSAYIGHFLNVALPLRLGDAARALVLARRARIPVPKSLMLVGLDRIADMLGLLMLVAVVLAILPADWSIEIPSTLLAGREAVSVSAATIGQLAWLGLAIVAGVLAILVLLYVRVDWFLKAVDRATRRLPVEFGRSLRGIVTRLADGLHILSSPGAIAKTLGFSLLGWAFGVLSYRLVLEAFGISTGWQTPLLMQAMVALFAVFPVAPGLVGQFHLAVLACLSIVAPDLSPADAMAAAIVAHLVVLIPVIVTGGVALGREGVDLRSLIRGGDSFPRGRSESKSGQP